jgi:hypothetical protein
MERATDEVEIQRKASALRRSFVRKARGSLREVVFARAPEPPLRLGTPNGGSLANRAFKK